MKGLLVISLLFAVAFADTARFTSCSKSPDSDEFQVDYSNTYTQPAEVLKNENISLLMNGYFNDDVKLSDLQLNVYWGGYLLQKIDSPDTDSVVAFDPYTMKFSVLIPSFAMSGPYYLEAYVKGSVAGGPIIDLTCVRADFTL